MVLSEWLKIKTDKEQLKILDALVKRTGKSRSEVLRDLIPASMAEVSALEELQKKSNRPARNTAKLYKTVFLQKILQILQKEYQEKENPFALQMAVCAQRVGQKPDITDLFVVRCRCEQGVRGYEIKKLQLRDSKEQTREEYILTGPGVFDKDELLLLLARDMEKILKEFGV